MITETFSTACPDSGHWLLLPRVCPDHCRRSYLTQDPASQSAVHNSQHTYSFQRFSSQTVRWETAFILFLLSLSLTHYKYAPYIFSETLSNLHLNFFTEPLRLAGAFGNCTVQLVLVKAGSPRADCFKDGHH